jgi:hypothetical protein
MLFPITGTGTRGVRGVVGHRGRDSSSSRSVYDLFQHGEMEVLESLIRPSFGYNYQVINSRDFDLVFRLGV